MTPSTTGAQSPLQQVCVAIDLETTGLDPARDEIIEVGAVRFRGEEVLDTFTTPVNPRRTISEFIRSLTGITQAEVDGAPPFKGVAPRLVDFVGAAPVVGQNVAFDLAFLGRKGVRFPGPVFDTRELASVLLPSGVYSLGPLARSLGVGSWQAHRALADARATALVLARLVRRAMDMDPALVAELARLMQAADLPLRHLLDAVAAGQEAQGRATRLGPGALDLDALDRRLRSGRQPRRGWGKTTPEPVEVEELASLVGPGGALPHTVPGYEYRAEQEAMLRAVAGALHQGQHLVVEAGTGVGKSMAYLLPAAAFALKNRVRVVVSTNTINLQEQLTRKDIPGVALAMRDLALEGDGELRFTIQKGRGNYLCMRRWWRLRASGSMTPDEARFLGKLACWLPETDTGDRADLRMARPDHAVWDRVSAQGSRECPPRAGACFLRAARERAEGAHLVVVNHALLLSDLEQGGGLLPSYDYLVVDEAHHLEAEATRQFGARLAFDQVQDTLGALVGPRGLGAEALTAYRTSSAGPSRVESTQKAVEGLSGAVGQARARMEALFGPLGRFLQEQGQGGDGDRGQLLVTAGIRAQPGWSDLELAWENAAGALSEVARRASDVYRSLDGLEDLGLLNYEGLRDEIAAREASLEEAGVLGDAFFLRPDAQGIYWLEAGPSGTPALCSAPLLPGELLRKRLFEKKTSVVLTSATLAVAGDFRPAKERLGLEDAETLLLGSPFDYRKAAMVCVPQDMPEPGSPGYTDALAGAIAGLAGAADGRTMALFTSHAALRAAAAALRRDLGGVDIKVLAQGLDGTPQQLMEQFVDNPRAVLLGTASFWEGVDLAGEALSVLVLARLPFDVPTEPVFAARSALYENAFREYAMPRAALRFRQGFGRLIRRGSDRGVVAVLDRRLTGRSYGAIFLRALPECTVNRPSLAEMPDLAAAWLSQVE